MTMNIKNEETYRLVRELADLTGETLTGAVTTAVRLRLEHLKHGDSVALSERLLQIGRETAPRLKVLPDSTDIGDLLYNEYGLPK